MEPENNEIKSNSVKVQIDQSSLNPYRLQNFYGSLLVICHTDAGIYNKHSTKKERNPNALMLNVKLSEKTNSPALLSSINIKF